MLHLQEPTDSGWYDRVRDHLPTIMVDHAHLEKRAASTALNLIFRYTSRMDLVRGLTQVVQEEMEHFDQVLDLLDERDIDFIKLTPAPYAQHLVGSLSKQEPQALLDRLVASAFIEARSCERFQILGENVEDEALAAFYTDLAAQEARHHTLYTTIARTHFGKDVVDARLLELGEIEAQAVRAGTEPRLHSF